ncbi:subtilase-type protease inhibitor [Streptomyces sp. enrichment culture]|uniref:subtilase-type protease inhibitor n=1 Tax=Streptomyces sp. enrichment culture TaxID=1795815 RepID=UPI003F543960
MRTTARWAATIGLTAGALCGPLTGAATAAPGSAPASLYAPSALVLTTGHGESASAATVERAVTLDCSTAPTGTHPDPAAACAELRAADGDLTAVATPEPGVMCTRQWDPVVITVDGVWQGQRVSYERTFANECVKSSYESSVFAF